MLLHFNINSLTQEGINTGEGRMIKAVLDMQDKEVNKIMQPRVEIVALSETGRTYSQQICYAYYFILFFYLFIYIFIYLFVCY
jgi:Mg2+/Co2+ transporter CorB